MVDFYKKYKFCLLLPKAMIKFWHKIPIERETEMKKIIALLVVCVLLAGCGQADKKIPEDMSEEAYDTGCKMIEVMDKYHVGDISKEDCYDTLNNLCSHVDSLDHSGEEEPKCDYSGENAICIYCTAFTSALVSGGDTLTEEKNLKETLELGE